MMWGSVLRTRVERNDRSVPRIPVDMNKENHVIGEPRIAELGSCCPLFWPRARLLARTHSRPPVEAERGFARR